MTNRERILAALNYEPYDYLPILHFGFLGETLDRWRKEGHLNEQEYNEARCGDGDVRLEPLTKRLGFDLAYHRVFSPNTRIAPGFETKVIEVLPDGSQKIQTGHGVIILQRQGATGIPMEFDHILKGRKEWEELFVPRLQFSMDRVTGAWVNCETDMKPFDQGGLEYLKQPNREDHYLIHCGSLYGAIRDYVGMENLCYLIADDIDLVIEMIDVCAELCYQCAKATLETGALFDIGHLWEDICYRSGPLVNPKFFAEHVGPHYRRITELLASYGINLVSLDCDGMIDALVPIWLENGVNVMFPIEVGTWGASIANWREKYGKQALGVGGMRKHVLAQDYAAIDEEVERLVRLVDLGGFIPCPDHRIADDAVWENVQYYTDALRKALNR
ncbi:MAG: hypothetical protein GX139_06585 [Armatimonadetes bacterium]|nr:hypothetical protein [Armatimonadota bacterium]